MSDNLKTELGRQIEQAKQAIDILHQFAESGNLAYFHYPTIPKTRWGWGQPPHPVFAAKFDERRSAITTRLERYAALTDLFREIPTEDPEGFTNVPFWNHALLPVIDVVSIAGMIEEFRPRRFIEIGSGGSTRAAKLAINTFVPECRLISIDRFPGNTIAALPDEMIGLALGDADLSIFDTLEPGDIAWLDGSHHAFSGTDVSVFFLEVIHRLKPGVVIGVHDLPLPYDYPPQYSKYYFNELMVAMAFLLGARPRVEYLFPSFWVNEVEPGLRALLEPIWSLPAVRQSNAGVKGGGGALWFRLGL